MPPPPFRLPAGYFPPSKPYYLPHYPQKDGPVNGDAILSCQLSAFSLQANSSQVSAIRRNSGELACPSLSNAGLLHNPLLTSSQEAI